jgi:hypothetical protein
MNKHDLDWLPVMKSPNKPAHNRCYAVRKDASIFCGARADEGERGRMKSVPIKKCS